MYTYKITAEDSALIEEFRNKPIGHHSPELQRVLNVLRGEPASGRYGLVCTKPGREWVLAELPAGRGKLPKLLKDQVFTRLEDAEWEVFRRRWQRNTGEDPARGGK